MLTRINFNPKSTIFFLEKHNETFLESAFLIRKTDTQLMIRTAEIVHSKYAKMKGIH